MKRLLNILGVVIGVLFTLSMTVYAFADASSAGKMVGVVTTAKSAALEVMDQPGAKGSITVRSVRVPGPSWIAVHLDDNGMPGKRIGLQPIPAGESSDVDVEIDDVALTDKVIVAVHADRGVVGTFEFSKDTFDASPDKPYFVDGMELAMEAKVAPQPFGVKANEGEAAITVADQPGADGSITVADAVVKLDPAVPLTDKALVALHADRGAVGVLEFDMMDKYNSPDQPFFVSGNEVATAVRVK